MNRKILALAAISSLCFFGACSEDSTRAPTRAELCANGISEECLIGVWNLNGASEAVDLGDGPTLVINSNHDFTSAPATLEFYKTDDGSNQFKFTLSPLAQASCKDGPVFGEWTVTGLSLSLKTKIGNTCMSPKSWSGIPGIRLNGAVYELDIAGIFFLNSEMENADLAEKERTHEVFTISVN